MGQSEIEIDSVVDFIFYVVPPRSGDGLQSSKKGVMEIADMICVNKYDSDYKPVCKRLQRQLQAALTLTRAKHVTNDNNYWLCPVELVSAELDYNVASIWETALKFREHMGEDYLLERRQKQATQAMWKYLSQAVMDRLKNDTSQRHTEAVS